jgi:predicted  nucleic acid-binding Zn-ribbon protein
MAHLLPTMLPAVRQLLIIQDRDRHLRTLRIELKNAPTERKSLEAKASGSSQTLEAAKLKAREIEVARKGIENEVGTRRDRITKYQKQKLETRKNDEFQALNHEIERMEKEIHDLEDKELDLMDAAEKQRVVVNEAEQEAQATKALVQRQIADLDSKVTTIEGQVREVETDRAKLTEGFDEDDLELYQRLFDKKDGSAVVPIVNEVCQGCHMKVTPQVIHVAKAQKIMATCVNCARIVYLEN